MVKDQDTVELLGKEVLSILASNELSVQLGHNLQLLARPNATEEIVNEAIALMNKQRIH